MMAVETTYVGGRCNIATCPDRGVRTHAHTEERCDPDVQHFYGLPARDCRVCCPTPEPPSALARKEEEHAALARLHMQTLAAIQVVAEGREPDYRPESVVFETVERLRKAYDAERSSKNEVLRTYGRHTASCRLFGVRVREGDEKNCTCGLIAALAEGRTGVK